MHRRHLARTLPFLTALLTLVAASSAGTAATGDTELTIRVLDGQGAPVEQARFWVIDSNVDSPLPDQLASGRTDAQGSASATIPDGRRVRVLVRAKGFAPASPEPLTLLGADAAPTLDVPLTTGGSVRGVLVDSEGQPAGRRRLSVTLEEWPDGGTALIATSGKCDAEGRFVVENLAPGKYHLIAPEKLISPLGEGTIHADFEIVEGQVTEIDIAASTKPQGTACILVDGEPLANATIRLSDTESAGFDRTSVYHTATTDAQGAFTIEVAAPNRVSLQVAHRQIHGFARRELSVEELFQGDAVLDFSTGSLGGIVRGPDGVPVPNCPVEASARDDAGSAHAYGSTDDRGRFEFARLIAGTYDLTAGPQRDDAFTPSSFAPLFVGSTEIEDVDIPAGGRVDRELMLPTAGALSVWVEVDGVPARNLPFSAKRVEEGFTFEARKGRTDDQGRALLGGFTEGTWRVQAQLGELHAAASIEAKPGDLVEVDLEPAAAATLEVSAPDLDTWDIKYVTLLDATGNLLEIERVESWPVRFTDLPQGPYRVHASTRLPHLGFVRLEPTVHLRAGEVRKLGLTPSL
ncbi:MAG: carboxypeptidase-like regulatory domain-containing protein [Planctomycetota bacterium]